jgi:hypothetical protein
MNPLDFITKGMAMAASYPLDTQWRFAVVALAAFGLIGFLALLPQNAELPCVTRLVKAFVPVIKILRLLAGRRQDWRGALLDILS